MGILARWRRPEHEDEDREPVKVLCGTWVDGVFEPCPGCDDCELID